MSMIEGPSNQLSERDAQLLLKPRGRIVLLLGLLGLATFLDSPLPLPKGLPPPFYSWWFRLLGLLPNALLLVIAVRFGTRGAARTGLRTPLIDAALTSAPWWPELKRSALAGVCAGVPTAGLTLGIAYLLEPTLPQRFVNAAAAFRPSLLLRVFYGGLFEEALVRWGAMSILTWGFSRLLRKNRTPTNAGPALISVVLAALLFSCGHLPAAFQFSGGPSAIVALYVLAGNMPTGLVAGLLFWRVGLESAMLCHASVGLALWLASN